MMIKRAEKVIAQGTGTYSKRWDQHIEGVYPSHCIGGGNAYLYGSDEKHYLDFNNGCGSNLRGHKANYSIPHVVEVEVAEMIVKRVECIDKLKFLKTGSEACSAAVRIARAYQKIHGNEDRRYPGISINFGIGGIGLGYHGWHNSFIHEERPGVGTIEEGYRKKGSLEEIIEDLINGDEENKQYREYVSTDYVIIEPVMLSLNVQPQLEEIRRLCTEKGIVLIFDEIITGCRVPELTISNWWGIQPDLICLGKALGNGYPLALVGGKKEIMDTPDYFVSSTHSGESLSLHSAKENLEYLTKERLQNFWDLGKWFRAEFNKLSPTVQIDGYATRGELHGGHKDLFMQEMCKKGYFFGKAFFLNMSTSKKLLEETLRDASDTLQDIRRGMVKLEGKPSQEVFKRNG